MSNSDDFFTPAEVDRQIDQVRQGNAGTPADAEALAYLDTFYDKDAPQEQESLNRIWNRITSAAPPFTPSSNSQPPYTKAKVIPMQNQPTLLSNQTPSRHRTTLWQRLGVLAAAVFLLALVGSMAVIFYSIGHKTPGPASGGPKPTQIATTLPATPTATSTPVVPFQVTSVDMAVTPHSIAGITCGATLTVTYKATLHVPPHGPGGKVLFSYTINNGRSQTPASLTFAPGETSKSYTFTWSGPLPVDHTYPAPGGIQITSPNQLTSVLVGPTGQCVPQTAPFTVTRVDMAVNPASIAGMACGTNVVVTYTATIHVAPNSPGGTVQFYYTINNGRGQTPASVTFAAGQTTKTFSFTWSGPLPLDHTYPAQGGIQVTSPNQLTSALVGPTGRCS